MSVPYNVAVWRIHEELLSCAKAGEPEEWKVPISKSVLRAIVDRELSAIEHAEHRLMEPEAAMTHDQDLVNLRHIFCGDHHG